MGHPFSSVDHLGLLVLLTLPCNTLYQLILILSQRIQYLFLLLFDSFQLSEASIHVNYLVFFFNSLQNIVKFSETLLLQRFP